MNIAHLLIRAARLHSHRPSLALGRDVVATYEDLARRVAALAWALRHRYGLESDDRVALFMANCPEYVELLLSCWHGGLIAVPVNAKLHTKELEYILEDSGARLGFVTPEYEATTRSISATALKEIVNVRSPSYERLGTSPRLDVTPRAADDVAWLFYTSGTTGRPKGVMITHRNLLAVVLNYLSDLESVSPDDSLLHAAPMSHGSGLYILTHVAQGALNIAPESGGFDPSEIYSLLRVHRGVTMFAAPTMVKRLMDAADRADTRQLKTIVYGGGPMYLEQCRRALSCFDGKLAQIYGQGEAPMTITVLSKARHLDCEHPRYVERLRSAGHAFAGVEVAVCDADDRPLPVEEAGEVLVRGDVVMRGYWQNEAATAETLRNGWLHTGDVGSLDRDGFLTLKDRIKDLIISGGSNIYPREVEEVLLRHPMVSEVAVVGAPDPEWGESVVAFVVARPGALPSSDDLDKICLESIARFKRPRRYEFVEALPKNMTGKVLKTELRAWCQAGAPRISS